MSETTAEARIEPGELRERLRALRERFGELRGRL